MRAAVITVSDTRTAETDTAGPAVAAMLADAGHDVTECLLTKDDRRQIVMLLESLADAADPIDLILTVGGTGPGPRDVTPEATRQVVDRELPAIPAYIAMEGAKGTKRALLSRAVCGVSGTCLILNLPGSVTGATESLGFVLDMLPHAVDMVRGEGH